MILADYLSRHRCRHNDPNDLIPISFCLTHPINPESKIPVCLPMLTQQSAKAVGVEPPPVHGMDEVIDHHKKPEHQKPASKGQTAAPPPPKASAPVPMSKSKSRTQELARKLLNHSKNLHRRHAQKPIPQPSTVTRTVPPQAPVSGHPGYPMPTGPPVISRQNQPPQVDTCPEPDDIGDTTKYTKRRIEKAQWPIPRVDLSEEEETLDPEVCTPNDMDFIKPPPLEELVDPK